MAAPFAPLKLGKREVKDDPRNLKLTRYLTPALPPPPASCNWLGGNSAWPMMLNDQIGDCVFASMGHQIQAWTGVSRGKPVTLPDSAILFAYRAATGYDPADPETDRGAYMLDSLNFWRKVGIGGHKIQAFTQLRTGNVSDMRIGLSLFGGVQIGLRLPASARYQIESGQMWYVTNNPRMAEPSSWGNHACPILAYSPSTIWCLPWGGDRPLTPWGWIQPMTVDFFRKYNDEGYAAISEQDWLAGGKSPGGFDFRTLAADLAALKAAG